MGETENIWGKRDEKNILFHSYQVHITVVTIVARHCGGSTLSLLEYQEWKTVEWWERERERERKKERERERCDTANCPSFSFFFLSFSFWEMRSPRGSWSSALVPCIMREWGGRGMITGLPYCLLCVIVDGKERERERKRENEERRERKERERWCKNQWMAVARWNVTKPCCRRDHFVTHI